MSSPVQLGNRFYLRVRVPTELQERARGRNIHLPVAGVWKSVKVGDSVKLSLDTRDPNAAKARFSEAYAALQSVWKAMREAPKLLTHKQMLAIAGELRAVFVDGFDDEPGSPQMWVQVLALNNRAREGQLHPLKVPTVELQAEDMERRFGPLVDINLAQKGIGIPPEQRFTLLKMVAQTLDEAAIISMAKADGDYSDSGKSNKYPVFEPHVIATGVTTSASPVSASSVTFASVINEQVKRRSSGKDAVPPREATIRKFRATVDDFKTYRRSDDAATVTAREAEDWKQAMLDNGELSNNTIGQRIQNLRTVIQWAREQSLGELYPAANPLDLVKRPAYRTVASADRTYTMDEAVTVLAAARKETSTERRWLPWMCAYSGARINEVAQLRKADFFQVGNDWFYRLSTTGGKTLKTRSSERMVPVHPDLLREGLIEFITKLSLSNDERIFSAGAHSTIQRWIRKKLCITRTELAPSHGWRHLFEDLCTGGGMVDAARYYMTGRATGRSSDGYGKSQAMLPGLAAEMRKFPGIPLKEVNAA
jgi:integrase